MSERVPLPLPVGWYCVAEEAELAAGALAPPALLRPGARAVARRGRRAAPVRRLLPAPRRAPRRRRQGRRRRPALPLPRLEVRRHGPLHRDPLREAHPAQGGGDRVAAPAPQRPDLRLVRPERRRPALRRARGARVGLARVDRARDAELRGEDAPQEMAENIVDAVHFRFVHGTPAHPADEGGGATASSSTPTRG